MNREGSGELRTKDRNMPLKHLKEILITLWLFRSSVSNTTTRDLTVTKSIQFMKSLPLFSFCIWND